ncbi:TSUP family transporter [Sphingomonas koreensis]|uniref:TSUP family transporter n=1 Tax=Sphingomonas koreensis TaxID=93064 RepID=UPI0013DF3286|nr:TSUP family transporter [Sphingomonas koreensis]
MRWPAWPVTTATSYALSGLVAWDIAGLLLLGGVGGAALGIRLGKRMAARKGLLKRIFAVLVIAVGLYLAVSGK